jgi:tetratricopeptide (TPR) repeat protein
VLVRLPGWQSDAQEVLRLAEAAGDDAARLEALEAQISLHVLLSDFGQAEATAGEALALAQQSGDRVAEARVRQTLGWHLADALGRSAEGLALLEEACRLADAAGAGDVLYEALCNLAFAQRAEGQCQAARASALRALAIRAGGPRPYVTGEVPQPGSADALRELSEANAYLGRWEEALRLLRPLLDLYQTLDDPWNYGAVLHNYGLYCASVGQHSEAISAMRRLVALSEAVGLPADSDYGIWHRAGLARALLAAGQVAEAGELLASLDAGKLTPGRPWLAWVRAAAEHRLAVGDAAAALAIVQPAADWWRRSASLHDVDVLLLLAEAALGSGDHARAFGAVEETTERLAGSDMRRYHVRLYRVQYAVTGDPAALAAFEAELIRQAESFGDPALRARFMAHQRGAGMAVQFDARSRVHHEGSRITRMARI